MSKHNLLFAAALLAGCAGGSVMRAGGPQEMYVHYQQVGEVHTAVVLGNLAEARDPARALARAENLHGAEAQEAWDLMQAEARAIQTQEALGDVARSVARMGMACGRCHTAMQEGPDMHPGPSPPPSRSPGAHMTRHQWAADRMWEGLVGPSSVSWAAGAGALGDAALDFGPPGNRSEDVERLARLVHQLGDDARHTDDWTARANIYGRLLETCATCHEYLGMRMR